MAVGPTELAQRAQSQESLLLDYLHRLEMHRRGRRAVHVHLSKLEPQNRREHQIRIAANTFEPLVKMLNGQLFVLSNTDLFFIYKGESQHDVETSMLKIRFLFGDDPALKNDELGKDKFCSYYNVESQFNDILSLVRAMVHAEEEEEAEEEEQLDPKAALQMKQDRGEPLTPRMLGRVEQALQRADISNMMRRQFICGLIGGATPQPLFSELFISISDLRETLLPGVNIGSSRWLFQHLTETLDRRVLSLLSKSNDRSITGEISINLNVSTILSPEFMQFDDAVFASMRGSIVLELQKVDIFADLNAYLFARDYVKEHGYRICVDGLSVGTMPFVNRERLGADMVKLIWETELEQEEDQTKIQDMIKDVGNSRVILCRCDDENAIEYGQSKGINMFQGRHIENLIAEENRRREIEVARRAPVTGEFIE